MCGIAGFTGVTDPDKRLALVTCLGMGVDERGGHAAGFVATDRQGHVRFGRTLGEFGKASKRFLSSAAAFDGATLLHARFATLANAADVQCAHPFAVRRDERTVLWGCHNGHIEDAYSSATRNRRLFTVDSLEVFELMADGEHEAINRLHGWGTLAWILGTDRTTVRLAMLSQCAQLYICKTECGATVFGSTQAIVRNALAIAGMTFSGSYELTPGTTYLVRPDGCFVDKEAPALEFADRMTYYRGTSKCLGTGNVYSVGGKWDASRDVDAVWGTIDDDDDLDAAASKDPLRDPFREASLEDNDKDWWKEMESANDFDQAAFMRWMAKDKEQRS